MQPEINAFAGAPRAQLLERAAGFAWVHSIDLGGTVTKGSWGNHSRELVESLSEVNFAGKKVLDIGCWDGLFSFMAEDRGAAEVYATDLIEGRWNAEQPTFQVAAALRKSKAKYFPHLSVYDVERLGIRDFDVVLFLGIYYHLRHPLLALEALRSVMKPGAVIVVEGAAHDGQGSDARFYHDKLFANDGSNWWVPSHDCLGQWVSSSGFAIERDYGLFGAGEGMRGLFHAKAAGAVAAEHPNNLDASAEPAFDPLRAELEGVYASVSWRLTAPLRAARKLLTR